MSNLKNILGPMRLPFVILTPACVLLGLGTAIWTAGVVNTLHFILALVGAVSAHICVNAFNEYFDYRSGLDFRTQRTPFSGGSGTLPENPQLENTALATAIITLVVTGSVGFFFLGVWGLSLLPLGLLGLLLLVTYTPWFTRYPFLCLVSPGLGFGTLMVIGTDFVLSGEYSWTAFIASLIPFFLVSDLLLLNQFPDVEADRSIGRRHYPITIGRQKSSLIYVSFLGLAYLSILIGVLINLLPPTALIGLITLVIAVPTAMRAYRHAEDLENLIPALGMNVLINILTPTLTAVGLFLG
ncbi:MAG: prenyltransferase [Anaerolineales bacterium]